MSQEWYYSVDGDRQGPVGGAELKKLAEAGTLKATDLVWKDGMADWVQARSIKGLFAAGAGAATPAASKSSEPATAKARPVPEDDEDRPSRARGRNEDDDEDDRPRRRRDEDDQEDDDRPARGVRRRDDDEDEDEDRPVRSRDDDDEDDRPRKRRGGRVPEDTANKKMVAGLLGILLGGFAVHKFYLGFTGTAVIQLLISIFTCGIGGWLGIIEGIIYLTKSDEDFHRTYIVEEKQWF